MHLLGFIHLITTFTEHHFHSLSFEYNYFGEDHLYLFSSGDIFTQLIFVQSIILYRQSSYFFLLNVLVWLLCFVLFSGNL